MLPSSSWLYASQKGGKRVITLVFIDESYRLWGAHRKGHAATDGSKRGKKWPAKWARRKAGSATWFVQSVYLDKWVLQDFHHMSCAAAAPGRTIKYHQGLSGEDRWWRLVAESLPRGSRVGGRGPHFTLDQILGKCNGIRWCGIITFFFK